MEASALARQPAVRGLGMPGPMLRMQSDERLIALTRRGNTAAFEVLSARYQARLLAFCRHMLGSREDAEDVLQEVFAAAYNAILADKREINAKPWLYRIARNRSLNHLRRASAVGVDSMDIHFAEHGITTSDKVIRRETFQELVQDVGELPESQKTALLLRELDDLSYDQIACAMETTVPSVKSLLVRARMSLADAAEARKLSCEDVRIELAEDAEGLGKPSAGARRHMRECERCQSFKRTLKINNKVLAGLAPVAPALFLKKILLGKIGSTSAGHAAATGGAGAGTAAGGGMASGSLVTAGISAVATKAAAGIAAAALVTAGAVAVTHAAPEAPAPSAVSIAHAAPPVQTPRTDAPAALHTAVAAQAPGDRTVRQTVVPPAASTPATPPTTVTTTTSQSTEVTTEETKLPAATTEAAAQGAGSTAVGPIATTGPTSTDGAPAGETPAEEPVVTETTPAATTETTTTAPAASEEPAAAPAGE